MRPVQFNGIWIDMDHVLAVEIREYTNWAGNGVLYTHERHKLAVTMVFRNDSLQIWLGEPTFSEPMPERDFASPVEDFVKVLNDWQKRIGASERQAFAEAELDRFVGLWKGKPYA